MKRFTYYITLALILSGLSSCNETWNEHYTVEPETVNQSVWDAIKSDSNLSKFTALIEKYELDSLFGENYNDVYTLFVPTNDAIDRFSENAEVTEADIAYHILRHYIQPNNIVGKKKIQTYLLKFAMFDNQLGQYFYDEIPVTYTSPLYVNGRYFVIDEVATPKPSLYEYISENNLAFKKFIDDQDSIILDKELSKPLGFNEQGDLVYDSVITILNLFEEEYFEITEEFRVKTATLVFPKQDVYEEALTQMALNIGSGYSSHEDIAEEWQQDILMPYLLEKGIFENQLEQFEIRKGDTLKNILGEDVILDYYPANKTICSNGYAYNYDTFVVLDSLYMNTIRNEGESFLRTIGKDRFTWNDDVTVVSEETFVPNADFVVTASNDSILKVSFDKGYEGFYSVEFNTEPLFPRRYLMVVRTHMDYGGLFDIYVNDELVKTFDYYDFTKYRGIIQSEIPGIRFIADGRYNKFDFWVDNITEYGEARIRFEYKGPSSSRFNGLLLDYIDCVPEGRTHLITQNP
ncbi:MAG: fasciclin domain-containing protein [Prolixibacteraceae bacterium]|jgi:uncharacterized surface protein with fasciclin (FAS1) repeats|nr:fasciclin domain-containing protein [Prolixibacteraceae bacterium]